MDGTLTLGDLGLGFETERGACEFPVYHGAVQLAQVCCDCMQDDAVAEAKARAYPEAKAPFFLELIRPKAEALEYLEA